MQISGLQLSVLRLTSTKGEEHMLTEDLFTQEEACILLKTHPRRFRKIVDEHNVPFRLVGHRRVFTTESIQTASLHVHPLKRGRRSTGIKPGRPVSAA